MATTEELWAREEIRNLYARYCFALDGNKPAELAACFTEDGVFSLVGAKDFAGRAEIEALIAGTMDNRPRHHALNIMITDASPDEGTSQAYFLLIHQQTGATIAYGHYEDTSVKDTDGIWRFKHRIVNFHWRSPDYGKRVEDLAHE